MKPEVAFYMAMAAEAAKESLDTTKVGAVLSAPSYDIAACNNLPNQVIDLPERHDRPIKYLFTAHAEVNAIAQAAFLGYSTKDADLYVTHHPCAGCARLIIQAGIRRIFVGSGQCVGMGVDEFAVAATMFDEAGVEVIYANQDC